MNKRGIDQVIAVVLLIGITISLGLGFFAWSKGYLSKTTGETSSDQICSEIKFNAADFCYNTALTTNVNNNNQDYSTNIRFDVENNAYENISSFLLILDEESGNSTTVSTIPYNTAPSVPGGKQLTSDFLSNTSKLTIIHVTPQIELNNKVISCYKEEQIINTGGIISC